MFPNILAFLFGNNNYSSRTFKLIKLNFSFLTILEIKIVSLFICLLVPIILGNPSFTINQCCVRQQKILTALASASPLQILIGLIYGDNAQKC